MKRFPLSIFSFDTLRSVRSKTVLALAAALLMGAGVEGLCRTFLQEATTGWDYWTQTAASKYITYARLQAQGTVPGVLTVGDSSADYGFSPVDFNEAVGRPGYAYNLATLGNFPLSFDETVNEMVLDASGPHPAYLFILFTRGGFERRDQMRPTERSVLTSPVVRQSNGSRTVGHFFALARLWPSRMSLLDQARRGAAPISSERGFQARDDASGAVPERPATQRPFVLDPERLAVLEKTFALCRRHGIQPILVHPPIHSLERYRWVNPDAYVEAAAQLGSQYQVPFWDYSRDSRYDDYMRDLVHLNPEGARAFSIELARRFQGWLRP